MARPPRPPRPPGPLACCWGGPPRPAAKRPCIPLPIGDCMLPFCCWNWSIGSHLQSHRSIQQAITNWRFAVGRRYFEAVNKHRPPGLNMLTQCTTTEQEGALATKCARQDGPESTVRSTALLPRVSAGAHRRGAACCCGCCNCCS